MTTHHDRTGQTEMRECRRGPCWLGDGHDGPCRPGGRPHPDDETDDDDMWSHVGLQLRPILPVFTRLDRERGDARAMASLWKETAREHIGRARTALSYADAAQLGRAVASVTPCSCSAQRARAERDEDMRDRWKEAANSADDVIRAVLRELGAGPDTDPVMKAKAVREARDAWREVAKREGSAESRPLTPDAITDEMVRRARAAWLEFARTDGTPTPEVTREMLAAALTEPPKRPAWTVLADTLHAIDPAETLTVEELAEAAWEHGVRVVGEERS